MFKLNIAIYLPLTIFTTFCLSSSKYLYKCHVIFTELTRLIAEHFLPCVSEEKEGTDCHYYCGEKQ